MSGFFRSRQTPLSFLLCLPFLLGVTPLRAEAPAKEADAALRAAAALYDGVRVVTLDNGLKVYLKPVPGAATVTTMVVYKVGSADENLDSTGLSHYLEHLMFKGTDKLKPGDIDRLTQRNGGQNNAYTSEDLTNYHFDFASERWEVALEIEADRMRNLRIDEAHEFEQEKGAVIQELQRNEDQPWELENKAILPLLFGPKAPYGHPVIGLRKHVEDATAAIIKGHYDRWYYPNNASLVVVGGFDPDKALARIKTLFGSIPAGKLPERKPALPAPTKRPERFEFASKFDVPRVQIGYNTVERTHPDTPALAVLDAVLSNGRSSRLYKKLVDGEAIASSIGSNSMTGRYAGWFDVQAELLQGKSRAEVEKLLLAEIQKLRDKPVTAVELKRAQQAILASAIFSQESVHGLADSIAQGVTIANLDWLKGYLPAILAVTPEDVQRVAQKYLDPEKRVTVWSVPPGEKPKLEEKKQGAAGPRLPAHSPLARQQSRADAPGGSPLSLKDAHRVVLPNGMVLLLLENHRLPIVLASASLRQTRLLEPADKMGVAALTGSMLDEGTTTHTGEQLAELIENTGGSLTLGAGGGSVQVLSPDRSLGLGLLFECLMHPNFPADAFARNKDRTLSALAEAETLPPARARRAFLAAVYGSHPFGRPGAGTIASVKELTIKDLAAFHARAFVPNNLIVAVVGDFDTKAVVAEIERLTKDWKKGDLPTITTPPVEKPAELTQKIITMPEATQLQVYLGHVGIRRNNPDFYKLLVMDNILGTGAGFTDRLSARLRDREGLAYTVRANITSSAEEEPGVFDCYIGIDPKDYARVKKEFAEEINRLRDEKPTAEEVADVKSYLLGSLAFKTATNADVAAQLLAIERFGLGLNHLDDYRKAVEAVTPEQVQEVARKYLDPKRMFVVAAGAIDKEGKVVKPPANDKK